MRKKIIAANWKMNLTYAEAMSLTDELVDAETDYSECRIIIAAPYVYLHDIVGRIQSQPNFSVAAQNCSSEQKGPFTGEISASMLDSIGVENVIIGHSERRTIFQEGDQMLAKKIDNVLIHGLDPIFCCGEELSQRKSGDHFSTVERQLHNGLFHIEGNKLVECIIAYEPVWAIGTGVNASTKEIGEMHSFIREKIKGKYGEKIAMQVPILYGGSVSPKNSQEIFGCQDVDGALVGGASLKATDFLSIVDSMNSLIKVN